ncbi:SbcC/MukB-like Walker B domain-containing protein, partial [Marinilabilia sp.]
EIAEKYSVAQIEDTRNFIHKLQETIAGNKKQLEEEKAEMETQWHHLQVQQQLYKYAHELEDGKPCPLCGSDHHPNILKADDLSSGLKSIEEKRRKNQKQISLLSDTETLLLRLSDRHDNLKNDLKKHAENHDLLNSQIKQHTEKFQWQQFSPEKEDQVTEAFKQHEIISREIKKLETDQEKINSDTEKAEKNKEDYRKLLDKIERSIVEKKSRIETLSGQFREVNPEHFKEISSDELTQKAAGLKKQYAEIGERFQKEEKQVAETGKEVDTLMGRIESRDQHLEQTQKELTVLNEQIETLLKEHGNLQLEKVSEIVFKPFEIDATRKKIDHYKQNLSSNTNTIKQYEEELNGRTFDEKKYLELTQENQKLNKTIEELNRAWGEANTSLSRLKKDQQKAKALKKEHDKVQERAEDLKMMRNLFKGGAFVNYISTVYLQELVRAANDRFYRLTKQHLSLELAPDNSFQVRDYMNEGHLRSVKTLSGGQTFQASLSLALALADSIQKHTSTSGNFFFLDEGFGTLDRESLNIVFDTLKSLRHENRIVGVISHVEDMQQEISTYLHIDNQEGKGSMVNASWEL